MSGDSSELDVNRTFGIEEAVLVVAPGEGREYSIRVCLR